MAFGEVLVDEHSTTNKMPYLFNGKELDYETGLYYYGARYYDPKTSIFLNVDPLVEKTGTPYAYTYNNPIRYIDPDGKFPVWTHYILTYRTMLRAGFSLELSTEIAHYASTYADHPSKLILRANQGMALMDGYKMSRL